MTVQSAGDLRVSADAESKSRAPCSRPRFGRNLINARTVDHDGRKIKVGSRGDTELPALTTQPIEHRDELLGTADHVFVFKGWTSLTVVARGITCIPRGCGAAGRGRMARRCRTPVARSGRRRRFFRRLPGGRHRWHRGKVHRIIRGRSDLSVGHRCRSDRHRPDRVGDAGLAGDWRRHFGVRRLGCLPSHLFPDGATRRRDDRLVGPGSLLRDSRILQDRPERSLASAQVGPGRAGRAHEKDARRIVCFGQAALDQGPWFPKRSSPSGWSLSRAVRLGFRSSVRSR